MIERQNSTGTIRKLWPTETDKFRDHLLRLDKTNRRLRFAHGVSDSFIEDYPGSRATVLGCTGVSIKAWLTPRRTQYLFATANDNNGWAFLENFGWVHLSGGPAATSNKLIELTHSRASGRPVQPFVDGTELRNVLVFD